MHGKTLVSIWNAAYTQLFDIVRIFDPTENGLCVGGVSNWNGSLTMHSVRLIFFILCDIGAYVLTRPQAYAEFSKEIKRIELEYKKENLSHRFSRLNMRDVDFKALSQ